MTKKKLANGGQPERPSVTAMNVPTDLSSLPTIKAVRDRAIATEERKYLEQLLSLSRGDIRKCCATAGLSRSRFYDLMKKYKISK